MIEEMLTVEEVARLLECSTKTVYRMLINKELPGKKLKREWRIDKETLSEWLRTKENVDLEEWREEQELIKLNLNDDGFEDSLEVPTASAWLTIDTGNTVLEYDLELLTDDQEDVFILKGKNRVGEYQELCIRKISFRMLSLLNILKASPELYEKIKPHYDELSASFRWENIINSEIWDEQELIVLKFVYSLDKNKTDAEKDLVKIDNNLELIELMEPIFKEASLMAIQELYGQETSHSRAARGGRTAGQGRAARGGRKAGTGMLQRGGRPLSSGKLQRGGRPAGPGELQG